MLKTGWRPRFPSGAASQVMAGSNQIVSDPRRLSASLQTDQVRVLQVGAEVAEGAILDTIACRSDPGKGSKAIQASS